MFAQKSINQQINNDIFINSTLMQIEKGIDLHINKFDINKDTSIKIQHDLMGLSINISFSAHHHYASAKCAFKIIPKASFFYIFFQISHTNPPKSSDYYIKKKKRCKVTPYLSLNCAL